MGKSKKKEKYVPLTGLTGIGEDYMTTTPP